MASIGNKSVTITNGTEQTTLEIEIQQDERPYSISFSDGDMTKDVYTYTKGIDDDAFDTLKL
jgi:hypothetical protein